MTYRIGWLSPLTPASGVGTFSHAVARHFPKTFEGEAIDLTLLHLDHERIYATEHRSIRIDDSDNFRQILSLFDLLVYNIGNNREHHDAIFNLLRVHPGVIVCHDYVYQHYLAERSYRAGGSFSSYAALLVQYGDATAGEYLRRSRITSRTGQIRYSPWDSEVSVEQPMSEAILDLGSALVVHSAFAEAHAKKRFEGPILRLGMPHDQRHSVTAAQDDTLWERMVTLKSSFHLVSFGHIQPTKCLDLVLEAFAASKMLRRKLRYTIAGFAGDKHYFKRLQDMVVSLSLRDVVTFETDVSDARLAALSQEADVFINLRRPNTEGSSASLIEQLDTGKPVVVLDSGCYAEVDPEAAVKLPAGATSLDLKIALERLVAKPEMLPVIGRAGRAQARKWTCASYGEAIVGFAVRNRDLLRDRGLALGVRTLSQANPIPDPEDAWTRNLARARASLRYLDGNLLAIDPGLVLSKSHDELCDYVAHVILGIFNDAALYRSLSRFFGMRDKQAAYWACVRFALIVEAVLGGDEAARRRLAIMECPYEPEFWSVVEAFPSSFFYATACLLLRKRMPEPGEFVNIEDRDGYPRRLTLLEFVARLAPDKGGGAGQLREWLEQPVLPDVDRDLPQIDTALECQVGSDAFRDCAELSGFYRIEPDHVWARGTKAFVGLRLSQGMAKVDLLVRHADATAEAPCVVAASIGDATSRVELATTEPQWLSVAVPTAQVRASSTLWLRLSADRALPPRGSADPRILGAGLLRLRVGAIEPASRAALRTRTRA